MAPLAPSGVAIERLRYDLVAFRGVHNSIDADYALSDQLSGTNGVVGRCAALELDLHQKPDRFEWDVKHGASDESVPFVETIEEVAAWSRANANHSVVTIHLDLKNAPLSHRKFAKALDAMLLDVFGRDRICSPDRVIGNHPDLVRGARARGWPTLRELRGQFVFCLSGSSKRKMRYSEYAPRKRLCFADYPGSRGRWRKGHRVFANLFVDAHRYRESLARLVAVPGFITRGYSIVTAANWQRSLDGGLNIMSTDVLDDVNYSLGESGRRALPMGR